MQARKVKNMKQLKTIFAFELKYYLKNKIFIGVTALAVIFLAIVMFFPRLEGAFGGEENEASGETRSVMLVVADNEKNANSISKAFAEMFDGYHVIPSTESLDSIKEKLSSREAECAFVFKSFTEYTYYVDNLSIYDANPAIADEALTTLYRMNTMISLGMSEEEAQKVIETPITGTVESLGKDQGQSFFYAYIMIFALYMVILLYGQMVATNVATEKSSRAMELLVTSAKPTSMMFGKVLASCLAGFLQLVAVFGSAYVFYNINAAYWESSAIAEMLFDIPLDLLGYMLIFFVLGFLVYAFLYGAIGSTASKVEDINTSVMPLTLLFIVGFVVVVSGMSSGNVDSTIMKACSFIPFTSPMAMFTRIALSTVPIYEIIISIVILIASTIGIGVLSAKIYRVGVLLYGTPPKITSIIKALFKA